MADYQSGSCVILAYVLLFENTLNQTTNQLCRPTVWDKSTETKGTRKCHVTHLYEAYVRTHARTHAWMHKYTTVHSFLLSAGK